ncbi:hypothetical protein C8D87_11878 [Lentzea atacamensis]|uniref:Tetratricopeptide repeat-containing protein n=1 Tax=Lentzea atacamensis TaxID=531938 RepID=A0ABX9DY16_9PSEU|nr:hypothetical protein [Lentzea atacamensis]RAS58123.1 hypothetical protein C8D87_11878 [Lentzea atacamensis]
MGRRFELRKVECETLNTICETLIAHKDLANAEKVCEQALDCVEGSGFLRYQARTFESMAHLAFARGDVAGAERHWRQVLAIYPMDMGEARFEEEHLRGLGDPAATVSVVPSQCGTDLSCRFETVAIEYLASSGLQQHD